MRHLEIEYKYAAEDVLLTTFHEFCKKRRPTHFEIATGYDHFFSNKNDDMSFYRHRVGPGMNQLTFKRKKVQSNSFVRKEHNIDLKKGTSRHDIKAFCQEFNYEKAFSLFKVSHIYTYEGYILVYYICYTPDMIELGRFIEIEIEESTIVDEKSSITYLQTLEKLCKVIGTGAKNRLEKSLFEMYKGAKNDTSF